MKNFISFDHYRIKAAFSTKSVSISSRLHLLKKAAGRPDGPDEPDGFWALALSLALSLGGTLGGSRGGTHSPLCRLLPLSGE